MGPMTGRRAGYCAGYDVPGYANPGAGYGRGAGYGYGYGYGGGRGRGMGRGMAYGRGRGMGRGYATPAYGAYAPYAYTPYAVAPQVTPEMEKENLKAEAGNLEQMLKDIQARIQELEENENSK